ncbi:hypothetical protein ACCO45_013287 [Purpureocillium lilacinum]|uniref:Uncharacterized protein n=1 Tax=Purpureocillium lilacinum TaxID=33203 RepID=A0ACC4DAK7_PURLI
MLNEEVPSHHDPSSTANTHNLRRHHAHTGPLQLETSMDPANDMRGEQLPFGQRIDDIENDAATDDDLLGRAKAKQAVIMSLRRRPIFPLQIDLSFEVLMCSSLMMDVRDGDRFRLRGDQIKHMHDDSWVMGPPNYDLTRLKYNVTDVMTAMLATQIRAVDGFPQLTLLGVMLDEFEPTDHADCRSYAFNNRPNIVMIRLRADPKHKFRLWDPVWDDDVGRDGYQLFAAVRLRLDGELDVMRKFDPFGKPIYPRHTGNKAFDDNDWDLCHDGKERSTMLFYSIAIWADRKRTGWDGEEPNG